MAIAVARFVAAVQSCKAFHSLRDRAGHFLLNRALARFCTRLQQQIARFWTVIAQIENEPPAKQ
jgi:hypothetical protein